jgi:hypothetical protein
MGAFDDRLRCITIGHDYVGIAALGAATRNFDGNVGHGLFLRLFHPSLRSRAAILNNFARWLGFFRDRNEHFDGICSPLFFASAIYPNACSNCPPIGLVELYKTHALWAGVKVNYVADLKLSRHSKFLFQ